MFKIRHYPSILFLEYLSARPEIIPKNLVRLWCFLKIKKIFLKHFAASRQSGCFLCCKLQEKNYHCNYLAANCRKKFLPFYFFLQFAGDNLQLFLSCCILFHILSLRGESNSRSRTIVAALPSGVSPPDWIPVHARSVTLRV